MKTQRNMIDFLNYYLSGGSLARIMGVAGEEVERKLEGIDLEAPEPIVRRLAESLRQVSGYSASWI